MAETNEFERETWDPFRAAVRAGFRQTPAPPTRPTYTVERYGSIFADGHRFETPEDFHRYELGQLEEKAAERIRVLIRDVIAGRVSVEQPARTLEAAERVRDIVMGRSLVFDWLEDTLAAGETRRGLCCRILVGRGSDTEDPLCCLPAGHRGGCLPAEALGL